MNKSILGSIMATETASRLLNLPAELRLTIYTELLLDHITDLRNRNPIAASGTVSSLPIPRPTGPSLLLTNKQLHTEALDTFWASTTIVFDCSINVPQLPPLFPRSRWAGIKRVELDAAACRRLRPIMIIFASEELEEKVTRDLRGCGAGELAEKVCVRMGDQSDNDAHANSFTLVGLSGSVMLQVYR